MEETEFDGDEIIWRDGMTVTYEDLSDDDEPLEAMFCFVLNDIFGEYTMTDLIAFEIYCAAPDQRWSQKKTGDRHRDHLSPVFYQMKGISRYFTFC